VYTDEPTVFSKAVDSARESESFLYSLGLAVGKEGKVAEVFWDSPAFAAGVAPGMSLVAVNGRAYSAAVLREAIKAAQADQRMEIEMLLRNDDIYRTVTLDYHGGLRYPRLERLEGTEDRLSAILQPRKGPRR
jgi:predicted metalloprotease with PDZ domain